MARKTTAEMVGEAFRELGTLLALFAPLERLLVRGQPLTLEFLAIVVFFLVSSLGLGIGIERRRKLGE